MAGDYVEPVIDAKVGLAKAGIAQADDRQMANLAAQHREDGARQGGAGDSRFVLSLEKGNVQD
jgi:hypothetical protein